MQEGIQLNGSSWKIKPSETYSNFRNSEENGKIGLCESCIVCPNCKSLKLLNQTIEIIRIFDMEIIKLEILGLERCICFFEILNIRKPNISPLRHLRLVICREEQEGGHHCSSGAVKSCQPVIYPLTRLSQVEGRDLQQCPDYRGL